MKLGGIIVALVGGGLFLWHLTKLLMRTDWGEGPYTHHLMSLVGGVLMIVGIWLYSVGRRRARGAASPPVD
jgi:hypothetical protein